MREWTEPEMSFSAGGFLSHSDGYCSTEQLQYYDMLADPLCYPLQEPDLQLLPHSQQQYIPTNLPFSLYSSPPSSTPSPSSSSSSSQLCHPSYQYSPICLEGPCGPSPDPLCGGLAQGLGGMELPLGRRSRVGMGGKSRGHDELCVVCGDKASGYHYNALTCEGCKGFFRRSVTKKAVYHCKSGGGCEMDMYMRRKCQDCRLRKCRAVGMLAECLLTEVQCQSKRLRKGGKGRAQEEEETTSSRSVSSTSRLPGQMSTSLEAAGSNDVDIWCGECLNKYFPTSTSMDEVPLSKAPETPTHSPGAAPWQPTTLGPATQASSASLTREQKYIVDRMVEAHRLYRDQDSSSYMVFDLPCSEEGEGLTDFVSPHLQRLLQFARTVPGFDLLDFSDQNALLSVSSLEVMFLLSAQQFSHNPASPSPALQLFSMSTHNWLRNADSREHILSRTLFSSGSSDDLLRPVLNFLHSMAALQVTDAEYALLTATALLCSDRVSLQAANCVERMQELILDLLSRACGAQAGAARGGPQRFGRLLSRLTELRTLHHNYLLLTRQQRGH